jgi:predicted O-methyltransferase YrrM
VATGATDGHWTDEQIASAREFNRALLEHPRMRMATVTAVGDGVALAVRA